MGPSQPGHQPADVVGVVPDLPFPGDHLGDPFRGPDFRSVSVGYGAFEEQGPKAPEVSLREPRGAAGGEPDGEGFFPPFLVLVAPAHYGTGVASDAAGHLVEGETFGQKIDGTSSSVGDQIGRTFRAHNGYSPRISIIALFMQESILQRKRGYGFLP